MTFFSGMRNKVKNKYVFCSSLSRKSWGIGCLGFRRTHYEESSLFCKALYFVFCHFLEYLYTLEQVDCQNRCYEMISLNGEIQIARRFGSFWELDHVELCYLLISAYLPYPPEIRQCFSETPFGNWQAFTERDGKMI